MQSKTVVIEEYSGKMALVTNFIKIKVKVAQTFEKFHVQALFANIIKLIKQNNKIWGRIVFCSCFPCV